jgi:phosphate transport system permease protein
VSENASISGKPGATPPSKAWKTDPAVIWADKAANVTISLGGLGVIAAVLGIFVFILSTVLPMLRDPELGAAKPYTTPASAGLLVDEHQEHVVLPLLDGSSQFVTLGDGRVRPGPRWAPVGTQAVSSVMGEWHPWAVLGHADGRVSLAEAGVSYEFIGDERVKTPFLVKAGTLSVDPKRRPLTRLAVSGNVDQAVLGAQVAPDRVLFALLSFDGGRWSRESVLEAVLPGDAGQVSALMVHSSGDRLLVGTSLGQMLDYRPEGGGLALFQRTSALPGDEPVTALAYTIGELGIVAGGERGTLNGHFLLETGDSPVYKHFHDFEGLGEPVRTLAVSKRDRTVLALGERGALMGLFTTAERTLFRTRVADGLAGGYVRMAPKGDGILVLGPQGGFSIRPLHNPHPEITWKMLFGKIWYEGYEGPEYVWQSTGGSDDFESKLSITPLAYGTLKGTFYALLFAVPLGILAALYTSQFMSPKLRAIVKPVIEVMAALPSVVLGFLAALLLAPMIERHLFSIMLGLVGIPVFVLASLVAWRALPRHWTRRLPEESELAVLALGLLLGFGFVALVGHGIELALVNDFKVWMARQLNVNYDQRNSLVVGFAMGFAVIPIIFTIAEDSLSSVPKHLVSASLSSGATPWQTATWVVLPVALSGIFSAVMIGFGRAVGETMIVLMATGNTPVMDFSAFSGFRALSANIAVEIPEAPVDGTLYRTLFFAGLLLFLVTFVVNTVAELVRLHLRRKYSQL